MGDISEMRGLIADICFIASFAIIISLIPSQFLIAGYEGRTVIPPEYFEAIDIQTFKETWVYTMNETGGEMIYGMYRVNIENDGERVGGHDFDLFYRPANQSDHNLFIKHYFAEWLILIYTHDMTFTNGEGINRGTILEENELENDFVGANAQYRVDCSHFFVRVYFGYNETIYDSPIDAWDCHGLSILIGINFDQTSTGYNAWDLIGMLLFFQLPQVHWIVNILIAIPMWIAIAYLTFIFILRAIGAIFGGGGA